MSEIENNVVLASFLMLLVKKKTAVVVDRPFFLAFLNWPEKKSCPWLLPVLGG